MRDYKSIFQHHYAVLSDTLTLALAYCMQLASYSTQFKQVMAQLSLEVVYFAQENLKTLDIKSIENLVCNKLATTTCEQLKNKKSNEKSTEAQKLLTEMYVVMINLKVKAEEEKKAQVQHRLQLSQYLHSMRKMDRIIREAQQGKYDYLQYLDFYKSCEKSLINSLNLQVNTQHKFAGQDKKRMFDAPFKSYQKFQANRMVLHVINRSRFAPSTEMAITSDEKGEEILHLIQMDENKHDEVKVTLYRSDFYIHYPVKRPSLIGFGNQDRARLGTGKTS